jgi:hypothetical protein
MITIAQTPPYSRKADKLLSSAQRNELIAHLSSHPKAALSLVY